LPSPALDFSEETFDLGDYFIHNARRTFVVTASGDSMIEAGIVEGDKLFIDQSIEPRPGMIVLAYVDGGLTVRRFGSSTAVPNFIRKTRLIPSFVRSA
ncbi:UV protection protein, partial [gut metagenome]